MVSNLWLKVLVASLFLVAFGVFTVPRLTAGGPSKPRRPRVSSAVELHPKVPASVETPPPVVTQPPAPPVAQSKALRPIILLRSSRCTWENGFVERDELKYFNVTAYEYITGNVSFTDPLFLRLASSRIPIVLVLSTLIEDCKSAKWMLTILAPIMTILMSDEYGAGRCIHDVMGESGLPALRQYSSIKYKFPVYANVNQQLLGNRAGMMDDIPEATFSNLKKATDRRLTWVFVGGEKSDRVEMVNTLKPFGPNEVHWASKTPHEMAELMMESTFAPNGRGSVSLECFRLYEASRLGAIPVVVGTTTEIEVSFSYHVGYLGKLPPWIYATTWADALIKMKELYANKPMLLAKQQAVLEFWDKVMDAPRQQINDGYVSFNYTARMEGLRQRIEGTDISTSIVG